MTDFPSFTPRLGKPAFAGQPRKSHQPVRFGSAFTPPPSEPDQPNPPNRGAGKLARWGRNFGLGTLLLLGGGTAFGIGVHDIAGTTGPDNAVVRVSNPQDPAHPTTLSASPTNVQVPPASEALPKDNATIAPDQAEHFAKQGRVVSFKPLLGREGFYELSLKTDDPSKPVTVAVQLNEQQANEIQTLSAFPDASGPLNTEAKPSLSSVQLGAEPVQILAFANSGGLLSLEKVQSTANQGTGSGLGEPRGSATSSTSSGDTYWVELTDGKQSVTQSVTLQPEQAKLITDAMKQHPARMNTTAPGDKGAAPASSVTSMVGGLIAMLGGGGLIVTRPGGNTSSRTEQKPGAAGGNPPDKLPQGFTRSNVSLNQVVGLGSGLKEEVQELVELLKDDPADLEEDGIDPLKGFLLHGPPGTGKTLLCKAIAHESGRYHMLISGSDLTTKTFTGSGAQAINAQFDKVRKAAEEAAKTGQKILLQVDEIDALGNRSDPKSDKETDNTINTVLTQIDNLPSNVSVAYTTNDLNKLDGALVRDGRLDNRIKVPLPSTAAQRLEILQLYAKKAKIPLLSEIGPEVSADSEAYKKVEALNQELQQIAENSSGFSPASLKAAIGNAAKRKRVKKHKSITVEDLKAGFEKADRQRKKDGDLMSNVERPDVTLDDLGGMKDILPRFRKLAKRLSEMAASEESQAHSPLRRQAKQKPILLEGPPGTGKTQLVRAVANEAKCNFIYVNGADLEDGVIGHGKERVKQIFEQARENQPCIVFIDEAETAFRKRGSDNNNTERENTVNALLTEMDGMKKSDKVFVMAATNRQELFDDAALSRFEPMSIPNPTDPEQRREILDIQTRDLQEEHMLADDVDLSEVAENTQDFSGRDLKWLVESALGIQEDSGHAQITRNDFDVAWENTQLGEKSAYPGSKKEQYLVAQHEILGHGLLAMALKKRFPDFKVRAVTTEARRAKGGGQVMGFVLPHIPQELVYKSRESFLAQLLMYAAGRGAERAIFGHGRDTVGGGNDYQQMEKIIINMVHAGMIPGFSPNSFDRNRQQLTEEERQLVKGMIGEAEAASEKIIREAFSRDPEKMEKLVQKGIEAKTVRNEQAEALFTDTLEDKDWQPLYEAVDDYIQSALDNMDRKAQEKQAAWQAAPLPEPDSPPLPARPERSLLPASAQPSPDARRNGFRAAWGAAKRRIPLKRFSETSST